MTDAAIAGWYRLDARDRIIGVDPAWDGFARANGGEGALAGRVVGRLLSDFLTGDATRMFMAAALEAARLTGNPRVLAYRCDAPALRRSLEMTLLPLAGGEVLVQHRLVHAEPRPAAAAVRYDSAARGGWRRCSQCLRLAAAGTQAWHATAQGHDSANTAPVLVTDAVCARCLSKSACAAVAPDEATKHNGPGSGPSPNNLERVMGIEPT